MQWLAKIAALEKEMKKVNDTYLKKIEEKKFIQIEYSKLQKLARRSQSSSKKSTESQCQTQTEKSVQADLSTQNE